MQHKPTLIAAAIALAAATPVFAGEALPDELPSMRTPVTDYVADGVTSRAEVKHELMKARQQGSVPLAGEAGDTDRVIAARDRANDEQAREIVARYEAEAAAQVALAEAEAHRLAIENEAQMAMLAEQPATGDAGYAAYSPADETVVTGEPAVAPTR